MNEVIPALTKHGMTVTFDPDAADAVLGWRQR